MAKRWLIRPHDANRIRQLEQAAQVPAIVAQLLLGRGIVEAEAAQPFLEAKLSSLRDPHLLAGVEEAAQRIMSAVREQRRITIYGDYDCDGMTGTAILLTCLQMLNGNVGYYVPNRLEDGYGLNREALQRLANDGTSMVISVDCGIASVAEAATAKELGLELVITDHHDFGDRLPDADVIVHPRLPNSEYMFGGLCGAGVAFKLAWAICQQASQAKKVAPAMREFLMGAIGLAAIGTIADVVPLLDENRIIVRHGLKSLLARPTLGLQHLLELTKLDKKPQLSAEDVAFMIAPRINAAGRLGQAQLGVELLTTKKPDRAKALAEYLNELNSSRDSLERSINLAAQKQIKERFDPDHDPAFVLAGAGWHAGVIGVVAGRLAEKYHRPVIMVALDELGAKPGVGSARSPNRLNLHAALASCSHHLVSHGGHAKAAGLKIDERNVEAFREEFCEVAAGETTSDDRVATVDIEAEASLSQLTLQTVQQIEQLAPFGQANPRPVLCASGVEFAAPPKRMGGGDRHFSAQLRQHGVKLRAVSFGNGDWVDELQQLDGPVDIAYRPVINEFNGYRKVELHLVDWRVAQAT